MKNDDELVIEIDGAEEAFHFIHWTDAHLTECDERDAELLEAMQDRTKIFGGQSTTIAKSFVQQFNELAPDLVVMTGDLIDAPTQRNIEVAAELLDSIQCPTFLTVGNHEWGPPSTPRDRSYWVPRLSPITTQPLDWHVHEIHGVNLLFIDDSNYQITAEQLAKTEELLQDGKSCILFLHIPLEVDSFINRTKEVWNANILLGANDVSPTTREHWGMGDHVAPSTKAFCELMKTHPQVQGVFAGHVHFDHEGEFRAGYKQYVTGGGVYERFRQVRVVPKA